MEHGGLRYPSRLRSLAVLATAADTIRAEIIYGRLSGRGVVAECFGYAGMEMLQRRAFEKITGGAVDVVYGNTRQSTRRYSIPNITEIANMQQRITAAIQDLL